MLDVRGGCTHQIHTRGETGLEVAPDSAPESRVVAEGDVGVVGTANTRVSPIGIDNSSSPCR